MTQTLELRGLEMAPHVKQILRDVWDPISAGPNGPSDEYDSYIATVSSVLWKTTTTEGEVADCLAKIETEIMNLPSLAARSIRAARALLSLRYVGMQNSDVPAAVAISEDGQSCLWVFRRPDGLFYHEQSVLQHEDDENGSWSWWRGAHHVRSGIFGALDQAIQEGSDELPWLARSNLVLFV